MKKRRTLLLTALAVVLILASGLFAAYKLFLDPYAGSVQEKELTLPLASVLSREEALADLDYMVERVSDIHPLLVKAWPPAFKAAYEDEKTLLGGKSQVTVLELWQSSGRVLHALGDAHTMFNVNLSQDKYLPLRFRWLGEDLFCLDAPAEGAQVISLDGVSVSELYERYRSMDSYEIESYARYNFALDLSKLKFLQLMGLPDSSGRELIMVYERDGTRSQAAVTFQSANPHSIDSDQPFVEYSFREAADAGIFTLRECIFNDKYRATVKDFFTEAEAQGAGTVIVDLRGNSGGNNQVVDEFLRYLPVEEYNSGSSQVRFGPILWQNPVNVVQNEHLEPVFRGRLYVLTDTNSFSAATDFAVVVSDNKLGKVIGEIPGNLPSSYGDVVLFQTPNAKILFQSSYKYFTRPDESKLQEPLYPDIEVPGCEAMAVALDEAARLHRQE